MHASLRLARPPTLTHMAASKLREAIISGQFQPGQRLVELELSDSFGVSRAPLREAFRILAAEGLVDMRQNRGCYVINPSLDELKQMVFFRALIEGAAAGLVASQRDPDKLDRLSVAHGHMVAASKIGDNMPFFEAHWTYHTSLIAFSDNNFLVKSWSTIGTIFRIFMGKTYTKVGNRRETLRDVEGFMRSLREDSPTEAEALVRSVILWSGFHLLETPIPNELACYVTRLVGPGAAAVDIAPERLADQPRRQPPVAKPAGSPASRSQKRQKTALHRAV